MTKQDARKKLMNKLKFSPEILQEKIPNKTDSIFYEGGIAEIKKANGTLLRLEADGEVCIQVNGKWYKNNQIQDAIEEYSLDDKSLEELERTGKLEWDSNSWFEVVWQKKGGDSFDSDVGVVVGTYDEGLELLESYYNDTTY